MSKCILWAGARRPDGYGQMGRGQLAHRHVWAECFGLIPDGFVIHHECETKLCVNPEHLRAMTLREHNALHDHVGIRRANAARRAATHCKHGHEWTEETTYWTKNGRKWCRACDRARRPRKAAA